MAPVSHHQLHHKHMRHAIALARRGQGRVEPNPMVGCVVVRDEKVIASGYHRRFGGPHGEADAISQPRNGCLATAGADVYVNLEPCSHHGKTPPCTDLLIKAGPRRVFVAMVDPFDQVNGRGIQKLRSAGIEVQVGLCGDQARDLNEPYLKRVSTGQPWVIVKWAQTVDGMIADSKGHSRWISGCDSRRMVHKLRARVDAIVVAVGTAIVDDPLLTARDVPLRRIARRVVVDPQLRLPNSARILQTADEEHPVALATSQEALRNQPGRVKQLQLRGIEVLALPVSSADPSRLVLGDLFKHMAGQWSATNVLVEGGAKLLGCVFAECLVDQVVVFVAPKMLGDQDGTTAVTGFADRSLESADQFMLRRNMRVGDDVMLEYRVRRNGDSPGGVVGR